MQPQVVDASQQLLERDSLLESRQVIARAAVNSVAEGQVGSEIGSREIDAVGIAEDGLVAVCRSPHQLDRRSRGTDR